MQGTNLNQISPVTGILMIEGGIVLRPCSSWCGGTRISKCEKWKLGLRRRIGKASEETSQPEGGGGEGDNIVSKTQKGEKEGIVV